MGWGKLLIWFRPVKIHILQQREYNFGFLWIIKIDAKKISFSDDLLRWFCVGARARQHPGARRGRQKGFLFLYFVLLARERNFCGAAVTNGFSLVAARTRRTRHKRAPCPLARDQNNEKKTRFPRSGLLSSPFATCPNAVSHAAARGIDVENVLIGGKSKRFWQKNSKNYFSANRT